MPHDSPKLSKSWGASLPLSAPGPNLGFLPHPYGWVPLRVGDTFCNLLSILTDLFSPKCS